MKETLKRTRWIWAVTYAFLTGLSVGRHDAIAVGMFALGGIGLFAWTTRMANQMCQAAATHNIGTVSVKFEADTSEATSAIDVLHAHAMRARDEISAAFEAGKIGRKITR